MSQAEFGIINECGIFNLLGVFASRHQIKSYLLKRLHNAELSPGVGQVDANPRVRHLIAVFPLLTNQRYQPLLGIPDLACNVRNRTQEWWFIVW